MGRGTARSWAAPPRPGPGALGWQVSEVNGSGAETGEAEQPVLSLPWNVAGGQARGLCVTSR